MTTRRKFIKSALPFTVGTAILSNQKVLGNTLTGNVGFNKPIVISTWDFGLEANKDAWAILNNKGRALERQVDEHLFIRRAVDTIKGN